MSEIKLPTHINGERVVSLFPITGDNGFVEAHVVTTDLDWRSRKPPVFTVHRVMRNGEVAYTEADPGNSLAAAVRQARKNAGWG